MSPLEAAALVLAYVAHADDVLSPDERAAIADALPELVPGTSPRDITVQVEPLLRCGKYPLAVGRACLVLNQQPLEMRLATLRSALLVARAHERVSDVEETRLRHLGRDLEIPDSDLERLLTGTGS